jgi:hypothetical protein
MPQEIFGNPDIDAAEASKLQRCRAGRSSGSSHQSRCGW